MSLIKENIDYLNKEIFEACKNVGRSPQDVKLIAVTKTIELDGISEAINCGITAIGENRVQEFLKKESLLPPNIERHLIGHLQKNKVKYIAGKVDLIHSVDSIQLVEEMEKRETLFNVLLQLNVSGESTKHGISINEINPFLSKMKFYKNIKIKGLMTMAPFTDDQVVIRTVFRKMKEIFLKIKEHDFQNVSMEHLSMGMSNDFKIAIEEGSTMIRIGSLIFGKRFRG